MTLVQRLAAVALLLAAPAVAGCSEDSGSSAGGGVAAEAGGEMSSGPESPAPTGGASSSAGTSHEPAPCPPASPAEAVELLVSAEDTIADPSSTNAELAAAGHVQQRVYRELGERRGWDDRVRAALPQRLRRLVADNVRVRREFRSMHTHLSDTLPAWRIVRPAPARALLGHYRLAERRFGVDWEYLAAINLVETGMGRIRGTSVAGAQGPMQFIPTTWDIYGRGDVNSPRDAILAAGRMLRAQGFTRPGGVADALYAYNNSTAYVRGVTGLAEVMKRRPRAYFGYYHWQIYYLTSRGDVHLPVGYASRKPIPAARWLRTHRDSCR